MRKQDSVMRDFIYLDSERVRSYVAQLHGGVPDLAEDKKGREVGAEGNVEGGIPLIAKASGGADLRYFRSTTETLSLHHAVYSMFEEELEKTQRVECIDAGFDFTQWTTDHFADGQFIRVVGEMVIIDYAAIAETVSGLPRLLSVSSQMAEFDLKRRLHAKEITQQEYNSQKKSGGADVGGLKSKDIEGMTGLIRELFGDIVRVKIRPSAKEGEKFFVATALRGNFEDTSGAFAQKYGIYMDADWIALGQVNITHAEGPHRPPAFKTGNKLDDAMEDMIFAIDEFRAFASGVQFPCVSLTPIAIYRAC